MGSVFKQNQFLAVYDDIIQDDYCESMINEFETQAQRNSINGYFGEDQYGHDKRKDLSFFFDQSDATGVTAATHDVLQEAINRYSSDHPGFNLISCYANTVKVQRTPPKGGYHPWHSEAGNDPTSILRCLVWMIYLNDTPEGEGTTEFLELGERLQPKAGRVVLFPADWTHSHRGNPVYSVSKYIATGWYLAVD